MAVRVEAPDGVGTAHLWATDAESRASIQQPGGNWYHNCTVQAASQFDCDPSAYNFQTWVHSPYMMDGTTAFALVHMEYHGWQCGKQANCSDYTGGDCANEAIQLWRSDNGGWDWVPADPGRKGAPANLVAVSPYTYDYAMRHFNNSELGA